MGVDRDKALRLRRGQRSESLCNRLLKVDTFIADSVPDLLAREALVRVNSKENNHAGPDAEQTRLVGAPDLIDAEPAARALVRKR